MAKYRLNSRAAGVVAIAVMCSRVLGLAREIVFATLFGSGPMGLFIIAFRAPNLLRDLFAEGALSTAFVTVFSKRMEIHGDASAWQLASKIATLALVALGILTALGILFADPLIGILAPGFDASDRAATVWLTQIMFPFILLVSLAALAMGMLNAKDVFGVPAMASSFFNLGSILGGVGIGWYLDKSFGQRALTGLAIGTLVGGFLQLAVQLPSLWKAGFRFRFDFKWRHPGVSEVLILMVPAVIAASAVQVNVMVNGVFASYLGKEAVAWLNNSFRLMQLPLGLFGVALATVTLPVVSRIAATAGQERLFGQTLGKALRLAVFLTLPSTVGLAVLAHPIIHLIYGHGRYLPKDTLHTAEALQFYVVGLVAYSCIKVLSPAFYAINRKWTPMTISFCAIGLNLLLNWLLTFHLGLGHRGLALSTALSAAANFTALYLLMRKHTGTLESPQLLATTLRCAIAAAILGGVAWTGLHYGSVWLDHSLLFIRIVSLTGLIGLAGGTYFLACMILRVSEIQVATDLLKRRLLRGKTSPSA